MLYHTVLFQFDDSLGKDRVDETLAHLRQMEQIPAVRSIAVGPNILVVSDGWDYGMTIVFDDFASMVAGFADHPLHLEVLRDDVPRFSRLMSIDVSTDENEKGLRA